MANGEALGEKDHVKQKAGNGTLVVSTNSLLDVIECDLRDGPHSFDLR